MKAVDKKSFIERAKQVHGSTYTYAKVVYIDSYTNVTIRCKKHGYFDQRPNNHLMGKGCPRCAIEARPDYWTIPKKEFARSDLKVTTKLDAHVYHGEKLEVFCEQHGHFTVKASSAVKGCHLCTKKAIINNRNRANVEEHKRKFILDVREIYGDLFDTSSVDYVDAKTAVVLVCREHGEFKASPNRITGGHSTGNIKNSPCPACRATGSTKQVTIAGKTFTVRGYEDRALRFLIEEKGVSPDDVIVGRDVPKIPIRLKKKNGSVVRNHWPDIFIKSKNMLIEVKSTGTFGLTTFHGNASDRLRIIRHKSKRAKSLGYDYRVMLFSGQKKKVTRLPLPREWDNMSLKELRDWFKQTATP